MSNIKLNTKQIVELKALATFGESGTVWPKKDADKFVKLGVVELGNEVDDGVQIRINIAGAEYLKDMESPDQNSVDTDSNVGNNANQLNGTDAELQKPLGVKKVMSFAIKSDVAIPTANKRTRTSAYPFEKLEIGQSFFVPATEERPEPAKTMGSTVSAANDRYSEVVPGQTRINRKQKEVAVTRQLRQFRVAAVNDGAAWGEEFAGVPGAGVWRVEVDEAHQAGDDEGAE